VRLPAGDVHQNAPFLPSTSSRDAITSTRDAKPQPLEDELAKPHRFEDKTHVAARGVPATVAGQNRPAQSQQAPHKVNTQSQHGPPKVNKLRSVAGRDAMADDIELSERVNPYT